MTLTLAAVQDQPVAGDLAANVVTTAAWIRRAAAEGAAVVLFAEAFLTGYDETVFAGALPSLAEDAWLDPVRAAVAETGTVAVVNTALREGGRATISDLVLDADGLRCSYAKQHLYDGERALFEAGDRGASIVIGGAELALSICYDANFPEHAAAAAAGGVTLAYLNSGAYFPGGEHRRDLHHAARALDNGMYTAFAGLIGGAHRFIGGTAIYDPLGRAVVHLGEEVGMALAALDPDEVAEARASQRMWADRRFDTGADTGAGQGERDRVSVVVGGAV